MRIYSFCPLFIFFYKGRKPNGESHVNMYFIEVDSQHTDRCLLKRNS